MPSYIHYLETSVPVTQGNQRELLDRLKSFHKNDRKTQAILHMVYTQSGIDRRHTVLDDYYSEDPHSFFIVVLTHNINLLQVNEINSMNLQQGSSF